MVLHEQRTYNTRTKHVQRISNTHIQHISKHISNTHTTHIQHAHNTYPTHIQNPPRYDGQIFVKPPEVLTRDRLLSMYQVKPVLAKLRQTLLASAGALVFSTLVLAGVVQFNGPLDDGKIRKPREVNAEGIIFSDKVKSLRQVWLVG